MPRLPDDPTKLVPLEPTRVLLKQAADQRRAASTDPLKLLSEMTLLKYQLAGYSQTLAWEALDLGYTWENVAHASAMSRASAFRRYGARKKGKR